MKVHSADALQKGALPRRWAGSVHQRGQRCPFPSVPAACGTFVSSSAGEGVLQLTCGCEAGGGGAWSLLPPFSLKGVWKRSPDKSCDA